MARSSFQQTAFIGGEVSPLAQGRSDQPWYRQALTLSLNGVTIEEGAWVRRSGTEFIVQTRDRTYAKLLPFDGSATCAFAMVFTANNLQFVTQSSLVFDNTVSTVTAGSGVTFTPAQSTWAVGDQMMVVFPDATSPLYPYPQADEAFLRNKLLTIGTVVSSTEIVLNDDLGNNPGQGTGAIVGAQLMRVLNFGTSYTGVETLNDLRAVQIEYQSVILSASAPPQVVQITTEGTLTADPVFTFTPLGMVDGPYLDPSGDTGTVGALTGATTFTAATTTPFAATDVGRHLRLFSQPPLWAAPTSYTAGENVTDASGAWWTAIINSTGVVPGTPTVVSGVQQLAWAPAPLAGSWAWGIITGYTSSSEVSFTYDTTIPNMVLQTANGTTIEMFQLGVYTATPTAGIPGPVYPTCGLNLQGRLWLAGAVANRFDTTISNGVNLGIATFSPTDPYGNVLDDSGISEIINSPYIAQINWMIGEDAGVVMGTINGEFLVFSSATNDPITPTNIDERMITKFGSQFIDPVRAGMATVFVHKFGRRAIEYLADAFSGKFSGRHLNEWSKHLSASGIAQLAYQEETFPCVWAIMNNGLLAGCTYRRFSRFVSEPANIAAWQRVVHGRQRSFTSMAVVPGKNGLLDRLFTITNDPTPPNQSPVNNYYIEIMQPVFDEGTTALNGWFCDQAQPPGPGRSGYDCGGGNASIFSPTGGTIGSDSTTPDVSNLLPYSNNGASPAVGQPLGLISAGPASYFDGTTALYMLPTVNANETSVSLSVWVASEDFPLQAGALFGSTALTGAELVAGATCAASILNGGTNLATAASGPTGYPFGSPPSVSDGGALAGGQVWNNVLISMKSNGSGGIVVTAAMNETVLVSSTTATALEDHTAVWKFAGQPTTTKDGNVCAFTIGGQDPTGQNYTITDTYGQVAVTPYTIPTLSQIVASLFQNIPLNEQGYPPWTDPGKAGSPVRPFTSANLAAVPAYLNYISSLAAQQPSQQEIVTSQIVSGDAQGNIPLDDPLGGYSGYRGSVAELLIWPGVFIDWTSSTNRGYLHYFDSVTNLYRPLSVGHTGGGTPLGQPYVYLSGPPSLFSTNRANGVSLTVANNGLIDSPLEPP